MDDYPHIWYRLAVFFQREKIGSVQRTHQALLKDGLTELMQTKPVQNITVRELTDYVNLNRRTFYLHYRDIQDLLEHLGK